MDYPTCGDFSSVITVGGWPGTVQWSSGNPDGTVDSIYVTLPSDEFSTPWPTIVDRIVGANKSLKVVYSDEDGAELAGPKDQVIVVANHKEHYILITYQGCLD